MNVQNSFGYYSVTMDLNNPTRVWVASPNKDDLENLRRFFDDEEDFLIWTNDDNDQFFLITTRKKWVAICSAMAAVVGATD